MGSVSPRIREAGFVLQVDLATAEVVGLLEAVSLPSILLKGPTLRTWLYPEGGRPYTDSDLLVPAARVQEARDVLAEAGFRPVEEERVFDSPKHALAWQRDRDGATVDLHVTISGAKASPDEVWDAVAPHVTDMTVGRRTVSVLDVPGRLVQVALHAAHHAGGKPSTVEDLRRTLSVASEAEWEEAVRLARALDALDAVRRGLALADGGDELADRLGIARWVDPPPTTRQILRAEAPTAPVVAGIERLGRVRGARAKAAFVAYKLFSRESLEIWTPLAARGRAGLWGARVARPFWLLIRLPGALIRLRRAARKSRAGKKDVR